MSPNQGNESRYDDLLEDVPVVAHPRALTRRPEKEVNAALMRQEKLRTERKASEEHVQEETGNPTGGRRSRHPGNGE